MSSATCELELIRSNIIKVEYLESLISIITKIVNESLSSGIFPSEYQTVGVSIIKETIRLIRIFLTIS